MYLRNVFINAAVIIKDKPYRSLYHHHYFQKKKVYIVLKGAVNRSECNRFKTS